MAKIGEKLEKRVFEWLEVPYKNDNYYHIDWMLRMEDGWYTETTKKPAEFAMLEDEDFQDIYKKWLKEKAEKRIKEYEFQLEKLNQELAESSISEERRKELTLRKTDIEKFIEKVKKTILI